MIRVGLTTALNDEDPAYPLRQELGLHESVDPAN